MEYQIRSFHYHKLWETAELQQNIYWKPDEQTANVVLHCMISHRGVVSHVA